MDNLLLHPATKQGLEQALASSHHALGLIGPYGAGKGFLAKKIAFELLGSKQKSHQILHILPEGKSIGIEDIRRIQLFLRLKFPGRDNIRRVVIIEDAQFLTIEAQNALLKTLEEPPVDTKIILTITDTTSLRQTVYSRLQLVNIHQLGLEDIIAYCKLHSTSYGTADIKKAYLISGGYLGLCMSLLENSEHPLSRDISDAKEFLSVNVYERVIKVSELAKDTDRISQLLFAMKRILSAAAKNNPDNVITKSMATRLKRVYEAEAALKSNPNAKLLLTDLAVHL